MSERPIVFGQPWFGADEETLLLQTLRSGWIGQGPVVHEFERRLAEYLEVPHVVAVNSCTAALHLSLVAAGIGPGDEVITTPFTFIATVNAIEHTGATPVLVDINEQTLNLDAARAEAALTSRTRAMIPVHFGGLPIDVDAYARISRETGIWIIEDAAHAIGAIAGGRRIGATASPQSVVCFSFYPNKNLATAEGGAICTSDADFADRTRQLRLHGLSSDAWARYRESAYTPSLATLPGYKYNWTDLQAAVALPQLDRLEGFLATREALAEIYDDLLVAIPFVRPVFRPSPTLSNRHALHLYQVVVEAPSPARDEILRRLREAQIGAAVHYIGINQHPYYADRFRDQEFPVSDWASNSLLSLPIHPHMCRADVERVAAALGEAISDVVGR
jgi:dTDP-4-amino-4,6-dideoxygalactose transaminase